jgi:Ni/Co efflux regulator RcnB
MKSILIGVTAFALVTGPVAMAQPDYHHDQGQDNQQNDHRRDDRRDDRQQGNDNDRQRHNDRRQADNGNHYGWGQDRGQGHRWSRGERIGYNDWNGAQRVDYRRYHLRQPPRGYEWRRHGDRFILAAIASGLIMSVILGTGR